MEISGDRLGDELSTAVIMFHEAIGDRLGLSAADHKALGMIRRAGPLSQSALASLTGLSPGAVTGLVDRLERRRYVRREPDPGDRRRAVITAVDSPDLSEIFTELGRDMAAFSGQYTETEWRVIVDYLTNTIEVLHRQTRRLSRPPPRPARQRD